MLTKTVVSSLDSKDNVPNNLKDSPEKNILEVEGSIMDMEGNVAMLEITDGHSPYMQHSSRMSDEMRPSSKLLQPIT